LGSVKKKKEGENPCFVEKDNDLEEKKEQKKKITQRKGARSAILNPLTNEKTITPIHP